MPAEPEHAVVGKPSAAVGAAGKVTGLLAYAGDLVLPRMLVARLLRSPHPHARIRAIDVSRASAIPGVEAVITGADLPTLYGILPVSQDEQALCGDRVRYVGDPVAAVAARDDAAAARALRAIEVVYEPLPAVMSIEEALVPPQVPLHDRPEGSNIQRMVALEFGDVDGGFARADHIREDLFFYEGSTHLPIEPPATLAAYDAHGRLTVWSSTQVPHYPHRALCKVLGLSGDSIRVVATPVGGGFGGKSDILNHEIVTAKLALVTGRPVKCTLSREEVFYAHRGRHPALMWVRTGTSLDGRILAMHFRVFLDGGAYGGYGVATTYYTGALQTTTYAIPAYRFEGLRVFTNKPTCGPKRGHGTPQPRFALECHMDRIADDLRLDPATLRRRNLTAPHSMTVNWLRITSNGLAQCLDRVLEASGYLERRGRLPRGRGVGMAVSAYLSGAGLPIYWNEMPHSEVHLKLGRIGTVTLFCGAADIGQGSDTVLATVVAEVLGLQPAQIRLVTADTDLTPVDLGSYSSRVTFMAGNAALQAAQRLREMVLAAVASKAGLPPERLACRDGCIVDREGSGAVMTWAEAAAEAEARFGALAATGAYTPPKLAGPFKGSGVGPSPAYSFSACVVEVSVDEETGEVRAERVWLAHDIGRALNPTLVEGQIIGGVYMGLGEALMEAQAFRNGVHAGPSMLDYKSPTLCEMPPVEVILVETDDPEGPFGAKECGQGPLLPVAPAVANAVYDAIGIRFDQVPITPDRVLAALQRRARGGEPRSGPAAMPRVDFPAPIRVDPPAASSPRLAERP